MKRWLFLDDMPERHAGIQKIVEACHLTDVSITHVWNVSDAIKALKHELPFDCVFLDHDLDQTDPEETGLTVAEFIAYHLLPEYVPSSVVIHSHNPAGAERMSRVLTDTGIKNTVVEFSVKGV